MTARLLLLRHGATEWAATGRWAGSSDVPLTHTGEVEAIVAAGRLSHERIDRIIASPLTRAQRTASIIAARIPGSLTIETVADWREADFGPLEGIDPDHGDPADPAIAAFRRYLAGERVEGPEPLAAVAARAAAVVRAAVAEGTTLLVGHGTSTRLALCELLGLPHPAFRRFSLATGTGIELTGGPDALRLTLR